MAQAARRGEEDGQEMEPIEPVRNVSFSSHGSTLTLEPDDGDMSTASDPFFAKSSKSPHWTYERTTYYPWFTVIVSVFELIVLFVEFAQNGGIEKTLWANVSRSTLLSLGAKFGPYIERGQWWRFINPMFLHIGFLHFFLNIGLQVLLGFQMEPMLGPWRMGIIYIVSGIGGNLLSAVFLPCIVEVGASSSIYGWISIYLADLLAHWQYYKNPGSKLIIWTFSTALSLFAGLLPYMDNFAHIGGSVSGLFIALVVTPRLLPAQPIWFVRIVGLVMLTAFFVTGFAFFYAGVDVEDYCGWCKLLNCSEMFDSCKELYAEDHWASCTE